MSWPERRKAIGGSNETADHLKRHVSVYGIGRFATILSQVVVVAVLSRIDGGLYLQYSLVSAAVMLATNLTYGWLRQAILRDTGILASEFTRPQSGAYLTFACAGLLAPLVAAPLLAMISPLLVIGVFAAGATHAFAQYFVTQAQGVLRPWRSVGIEGTRLGLTAALPAVLWVTGVHVTLGTVIWCITIANLSASVPSWMAAGRMRKRNLARDLSFGFPIAIWLALSTLLQFSDRWVLAVRVSEEVAASYAASFDLITRGAGAFLAPLIVAAHPLIMLSANRQGAENMRHLFRRLAGYFVGGSAIVLLGAIVFSRWGYLLAPSADTGISLAVALALSGIAWQMALLLHKPFEIKRQTTLMVLALALALVWNVVINWAFAPAYGSVLVGANNALSVVVYVSLLYLVSRRGGDTA